MLHLANQSATNTAHFLLTDIDVPWVMDTSRDLWPPDADRLQMFQNHMGELVRRHLPFTLIHGSWKERMEKAVAAAEAVIRR